MIQRMGGRKFVKGLILITTGILVEFVSPRGLTPTMAGFLASMGMSYFLANVADKRSLPAATSLETKVDTLTETAANTQTGVGLLVQYVNSVTAPRQ